MIFPTLTEVLSIPLFAFKTNVDSAGTVNVTFSFLMARLLVPNRTFQPPTLVADVIVAFIGLVELLKATRYSRFSTASFLEITNNESFTARIFIEPFASPGLAARKEASFFR